MNNKRFLLAFVLISILSISGIKGANNSSIEVYDYPETIVTSSQYGYLKRSTIFEVSVSNGSVTKPVYVMADRNQFQTYEPNNGQAKKMTKHNHTAGFSFDGTVTVSIKRKDGGSLNNAVLYPKTKGYSYRKNGNQIDITLNKWAYIYVEFPDLAGEEPLFIFADPAEVNAPKKTDANVELLNANMSAATLKQRINSTTKSVIYFEEGVYDFNSNLTNNTYPGYQIPMRSNKTYYIPGGAVVVGSFLGTASNCIMKGRGIITNSSKARNASGDAIPYNMYMMNGSGTGNVLEGIHFCAPSHFAVLSRGDLNTRYCKMFGWYHQTDGWGGDHNAVISDCFIKANDDFIKVYRNNQTVRNVIMYKQINGGAIQFGWNAFGSANGCTVDGLYIIKDDPKIPGAITNTAVISLVNNDKSPIQDITIKNVFIEDDVQRVVGFDLNGGTMSNISIENLTMNGQNLSGNNYIGARGGGVYSNIKFKNIVVNGKKIMSDADWNLKQYNSTNKTSPVLKPLTTIIYESDEEDEDDNQTSADNLITNPGAEQAMAYTINESNVGMCMPRILNYSDTQSQTSAPNTATAKTINKGMWLKKGNSIVYNKVYVAENIEGATGNKAFGIYFSEKASGAHHAIDDMFAFQLCQKLKTNLNTNKKYKFSFKAALNNDKFAGKTNHCEEIGICLVQRVNNTDISMTRTFAVNTNDWKNYSATFDLNNAPAGFTGENVTIGISIKTKINNGKGEVSAIYLDNISLMETTETRAESEFIDSEETEVTGLMGNIRIAAPIGTSLALYTINGTLIKNERIRSNETYISVQAGMYIAKVGTTVQKIMVK